MHCLPPAAKNADFTVTGDSVVTFPQMRGKITTDLSCLTYSMKINATDAGDAITGSGASGVAAKFVLSVWILIQGAAISGFTRHPALNGWL